MKRKKVLNNSGFMLVETLIVGVFIMGIFSLLYTNFFPLIGEYERYRDYDTVESTYVAHWARMIALKGLPDNIYNTAATNGYVDISDCNLYTNSDGVSSCSSFKAMNNVSKIYLTTYSTTNFKNFVKDNNSYDRRFREYIAYLPSYSKNTNKTSATGYYRVIVEYVSNDTYEYGNIEVYNDFSADECKDGLANYLLANIGSNGSTYDDGEDTFITGTEPNNYIWYSGKLWRAVSVNNEDKTVKLVTQQNISTLAYNENNKDTAFDASYIEKWLNDTSVDGFLGNLREPEKFIVMDSEWNATSTTDEEIKPTKTNMVTDAVGLISVYEYLMTYYNSGIDSSDSYLHNGLTWWTLSPYNNNRSWSISTYDGDVEEEDSAYEYGVRPAINLKCSVKIAGGNGTASNPYRLDGDNDTSLNGVRLNTRYSGEYIRFGTGANNLYRIVSHETSGLTKIVSSEPLSNGGSFLELAFGNNTFYASNNTIGSFLNGSYLTGGSYLTSSQVNMIQTNNVWYLGIVEDTIAGNGNYKLAKYSDESMTSTISRTTTATVGLLRFGELMSGAYELRDSDPDERIWLLTPQNSSYVWYVDGMGQLGAIGPAAFSYLVRPAMNLKSNVIITGGDGTQNNPFTISLG